jgi:putative MFS transporter
MPPSAPYGSAPIADAGVPARGAAGGDDPGGLGARLDALPSAWPAWRPIILVSLGGCFEFYDLMMTAYVSPGLVKAGVFHVGKAGLLGQSDQATFAAATFLGLFIGASGLARVADRFGRRAIFTASLVWYAAATLAMAGAQTAAQLDLMRLIAGIGIGVELVTIDAYVAEMAPARLRGRAFAISQSVQFLAVPVVAFACWRLLPLSPLGIAGWRWVMILGASGAAGVWLIRAGLPESPRWLARRGRWAEAEATLRRMEGAAAPPAALARPAGVAPAPEPAGRLAEAFSPAYRKRTAMLVIFNVFQAIGFYGFGNWAPSLIAARGHSVTQSLLYAFAIAAAYPLGPLICSLFADRLERKTQIIAAAAGTAALGLAFAGQSAPAALIALGIGLTVSNNLLSFSYHAYQTELYPTRMRASAVGFVYAWSRISTVASSYVIAGLLGAFGAAGVFAFIALAMAVVIAAVGLMGPRTAGLGLERLSG